MASVVGEFVRNKYPNRLIKLKVMPYNKYLNIQACENIIKLLQMQNTFPIVLV